MIYKMKTMTNQITQKEIGKIIVARRGELGMTQSGLAKLLRTSQSAIARIEKGEQNLTTETLVKISQALKKDLVPLLSGESRFFIEGGHVLEGKIQVQGAKNSALKILAATLLYKNPVTIRNLPLVEDIFRMIELLEDLGAKVRWTGERSVEVDVSRVKRYNLNPAIAKRFRGSIVLVGPLLARLGKAVFPHPGGCVIGERPIDLFLNGWKSMGARVSESGSGYSIVLKRPRDTDYLFRHVSVTGTETLMLTGTVVKGRAILRNSAMEPEVLHLADFLNQSGAAISGAGTNTVEITGTKGALLTARKPFHVLPDRIETASLLVLGALSGKKVIIENCIPLHVRQMTNTLRDAGVLVKEGVVSLIVQRPKMLAGVSVRTHEYPGFVTDFQAPFTVLLTQARGESTVLETIFDGRLNYIEDLNRMGAHITMHNPHRISVSGPSELHGREIESPDLRAGLAFVIAALIARGKSVVSNIYQIDRGYERIDERLRALGARISRG